MHDFAFILTFNRFVCAIFMCFMYMHVPFPAANASAPMVSSSNVFSELDECDNCCMVTVEWSEPFISCAGSVSQYVLSVTPPTCDCPSSENCDVVMDSMDSTALYTLSGNQREYNITVNGTMSLVYKATVRADTCDNELAGELSSVHNINLEGIYIHVQCIYTYIQDMYIHVCTLYMYTCTLYNTSCEIG